MATYPRVPTGNNKQYTLDSQAAQGASTFTLNESVAGIVRAPGYFAVDRIDSSGNVTASKREYKYFTGVSGAQLTGVTNADGTDQVHAVGAIVEFVPDVKFEQDKYDVFTTEHSTSGTHASLASLSYAYTQSLVVASTASIQSISVSNFFSASGASIQAIPLIPTWIYQGTISGASAQIGVPLTMPVAGKIQWITATLRIGASQASVAFDITKNGANMLSGSNVLSIPINGTFASTASIATATFSARDVLNISISNASSLGQDLSITAYSR